MSKFPLDGQWALLAAFVAVTAALILLNRFLDWRSRKRVVSRFKRHSMMIVATLASVLIVVSRLEDPFRADVLKLLGVLLSAAVAFSSATLIANAMSGLMLRAQRHFRSGDYIQVGEHYGGIVERGLFFTEIQNELRDRVILPNSFLTNQPVTVMRARSTLIEARVSLGYDVPRSVIEPLLISAAEAAELDEPRFVEILELGDYSVQYRVVGIFPRKLKDLPTARSCLKAQVLDTLHRAGIEIVSPAFMNQRLLPDGQDFVPAVQRAAEDTEPKSTAGKVRFEDVEEAGSAARWADLAAKCEEEIQDLGQELGAASDAQEREKLEIELERAKRKREVLLEKIKQREEDAAEASL